MKIAVYSASYGRTAKPIVQQDGAEVFRINDSVRPLHEGLSPRMQAKMIKLLPWLYIGYQDVYIWVDGQFTVPSSDFAQQIVEHLGENDFAFFKHPFWQSPHKEAETVLATQSDRYNLSNFRDMWNKYQKAGLKNTAPFWASGCFAWRFGGVARNFMQTWANECIVESAQDQLTLSYLLNVYYKDLFDCKALSMTTIDLDIYNNPLLK